MARNGRKTTIYAVEKFGDQSLYYITMYLGEMNTNQIIFIPYNIKISDMQGFF